MPLQRPLNIPGRRKVLTKNMILDAQSSCKSASECARWLNVSFNTYKKWAMYYQVYENLKNQSGKGIKKGFATYRISLEDIFSGLYLIISLHLIGQKIMQLCLKYLLL